MKVDVPLDPVDVRLLGPDAVVLEPDRIPHLVQKPGLFLAIALILTRRLIMIATDGFRIRVHGLPPGNEMTEQKKR
jgi:hypothetical protein